MQRRRKILLTAVSAALGVVALAMPAEGLAAEKVPVWARYTVTIQGRAVYRAHTSEGDRDAGVHAWFSYSGAVHNVTFHSSSGFDPAPYGTAKISNVRLNLAEWNWAPHANPATGGCKGSSGTVTGHGLYVHGGSYGFVMINPFAGVSLDAQCEGIPARDGVHNFPFVNVELPHGDYDLAPFNVAFNLPPEALRMGKVIERFNWYAPQRRCPNGPATTSCFLNTRGQVIFRRTAVSREMAELGRPTSSGTTPSGGGSGSSSVTHGASIAADASAATVKVGCAGPCGYAVEAFVAAVRGRATDAVSAHPIASAHGVLGAAGSKRVTLRFPAAARGAIRRAGGVRLLVLAMPVGGQPGKPQTVTLRLRGR